MRNTIAILLFAGLALFATELDSQAGQPAARVGDQQVCPLITNFVPHVGGPILTGANTVLICGQPAARVSDTCSCVGPPSTIISGSNTVLIGGLPAARQTSATNHTGVVVPNKEDKRPVNDQGVRF